MMMLGTAYLKYSHFKQSIYLNKIHKLRRHKKLYLYKKNPCGICIPLFQSSQTQINLRMNIMYSETVTFTIDNSNTTDHIHRSINIHRALSIWGMFSGLQLMWSAD